MGVGKTTIGRILAKKLGLRFIDSDHEIEARTGASISCIFEIEGEQSFRRREAEMIAELTAQRGIVLATGGGSILNPQSRAYLKERGTVIFLQASVHSILARTRHDKNRPLLQTADPRKRIEELMHQREPYYREVADMTIHVGRANIQTMIQTILMQLDQLSYQHNTNESKKLNESLMSTPATSITSTTFTTSSHLVDPIHLQVDLGDRNYPITIGASLLSEVKIMTRHMSGQRVVVVTNTVVAPLYLESLKQTLHKAGKQVIEVILPDGEEEKNWANLMRIFDTLLTEKCDRHTTLIALGGGVIGDMTGFAAASYMRGVPFIQIPTTLLAQVDSSVGGKTGINHPLGKNMIGAFYQPQAVIADIATLQTLPERELPAGLAEIIKYGAIIDRPFFDWIEANMTRLLEQDAQALMYAISRSCEIKADVVAQDERESGLRAILNFGHTFGHAIEAGLGYGVWLHGEAVGCGMVMAADLSCRMGWLSETDKARIITVVRAAGLPTVAPDLGTTRWLELMSVDKKNKDGKIKFILLKDIGVPEITTVPTEVLIETLQACVQ